MARARVGRRKDERNVCLEELMRVLRKDQVYFVNKRQDGSSELYSLFDFKDFRENMDLEKAYMQGRFDAIPYIDESERKHYR